MKSQTFASSPAVVSSRFLLLLLPDLCFFLMIYTNPCSFRWLLCLSDTLHLAANRNPHIMACGSPLCLEMLRWAMRRLVLQLYSKPTPVCPCHLVRRFFNGVVLDITDCPHVECMQTRRGWFSMNLVVASSHPALPVWCLTSLTV